MAGELGRRLAVAGVGVPLGVLLCYLGGWFMGVILAAVAALGAREYYDLASRRGGDALGFLGATSAALLVLLATWAEGFTALAVGAWTLLVILGMTSMVGATWLRGVDGGPLSAAAATVTGALYTGGGLSFAVLIRGLEPTGPLTHDAWAAPLLLLLVFVVTWLGDTFAYFGGKRFGRHKLSPALSPGKTVEGSVAGLLGSVGSGALMVWLAAPILGAGYGLTALDGALLGLVLAVVAQVGDLAESVLKREAGVKDSGELLPGHGGVLDRFDALFFTFPVGYAVIRILGVLG